MIIKILLFFILMEIAEKVGSVINKLLSLIEGLWRTEESPAHSEAQRSEQRQRSEERQRSKETHYSRDMKRSKSARRLKRRMRRLKRREQRRAAAGLV